MNIEYDPDNYPFGRNQSTYANFKNINIHITKGDYAIPFVIDDESKTIYAIGSKAVKQWVDNNTSSTGSLDARYINRNANLDGWMRGSNSIKYDDVDNPQFDTQEKIEKYVNDLFDPPDRTEPMGIEYDVNSFPFGKNQSHYDTNKDINIHITSGNAQIPIVVNDKTKEVYAQGTTQVKNWLKNNTSNSLDATYINNNQALYNWRTDGVGSTNFDDVDNPRFNTQQKIDQYIDTLFNEDFSRLEPTGNRYNDSFDIVRDFHLGTDSYRIITTNQEKRNQGKAIYTYLIDERNNRVDFNSQEYQDLMLNSSANESPTFKQFNDWQTVNHPLYDYPLYEDDGFYRKPIFNANGHMANEIEEWEYNAYVNDPDMGNGKTMEYDFFNGVAYIHDPTANGPGLNNFVENYFITYDPETKKIISPYKKDVDDGLQAILNIASVYPEQREKIKEIYDTAIEQYYETTDRNGNVSYGDLTPEMFVRWKNNFYPLENEDFFDDNIAGYYNPNTGKYEYYQFQQVEGRTHPQLKQMTDENFYHYALNKMDYDGDTTWKDKMGNRVWRDLENQYARKYQTNLINDDTNQSWYLFEDEDGTKKAYKIDKNFHRENTYTYDLNKVGDDWVFINKNHDYEGQTVEIGQTQHWSDKAVEDTISYGLGQRVWNPYGGQDPDDVDGVINIGTKENPDIWSFEQGPDGKALLRPVDNHGRIIGTQEFTFVPTDEFDGSKGFDLQNADGVTADHFEEGSEEYFENQSKNIWDESLGKVVDVAPKLSVDYTIQDEDGNPINLHFQRDRNGLGYAIRVDDNGYVRENEKGGSDIYGLENVDGQAQYTLKLTNQTSDGIIDFENWDTLENGNSRVQAPFTRDIAWEEIDDIDEYDGVPAIDRPQQYMSNWTMSDGADNYEMYIGQDEDGKTEIFELNEDGYRLNSDDITIKPDPNFPNEFFNVYINGKLHYDPVTGDVFREDREYIDDILKVYGDGREEFKTEDENRQKWIDSYNAPSKAAEDYKDDPDKNMYNSYNVSWDGITRFEAFLDEMGYKFENDVDREYIIEKMRSELYGIGKEYTMEDIVDIWDDNRQEWMEDVWAGETGTPVDFEGDQYFEYIKEIMKNEYGDRYTEQEITHFSDVITYELQDQVKDGKITGQDIKNAINEKDVDWYDREVLASKVTFNNEQDVREYVDNLFTDGYLEGFDSSNSQSLTEDDYEEIIQRLYDADGPSRGNMLNVEDINDVVKQYVSEEQDKYETDEMGKAYRDYGGYIRNNLIRYGNQDWQLIHYRGTKYDMGDDDKWVLVNMRQQRYMNPPDDIQQKIDAGEYTSVRLDDYIDAYNMIYHTSFTPENMFYFKETYIDKDTGLPHEDPVEVPLTDAQKAWEATLQARAQNVKVAGHMEDAFDKFQHIDSKNLKEGWNAQYDRTNINDDEFEEHIEKDTIDNSTLVHLLDNGVGISFGDFVPDFGGKEEWEKKSKDETLNHLTGADKVEMIVRSYLQSGRQIQSNQAIREYYNEISKDKMYHLWIDDVFYHRTNLDFEAYKYEKLPYGYDKFTQSLGKMGKAGLEAVGVLWATSSAISNLIKATFLKKAIIQLKQTKRVDLRVAQLLSRIGQRGSSQLDYWRIQEHGQITENYPDSFDYDDTTQEAFYNRAFKQIQDWYEGDGTPTATKETYLKFIDAVRLSVDVRHDYLTIETQKYDKYTEKDKYGFHLMASLRVVSADRGRISGGLFQAPHNPLLDAVDEGAVGYGGTLDLKPDSPQYWEHTMKFISENIGINYGDIEEGATDAPITIDAVLQKDATLLSEFGSEQQMFRKNIEEAIQKYKVDKRYVDFYGDLAKYVGFFDTTMGIAVGAVGAIGGAKAGLVAGALATGYVLGQPVYNALTSYLQKYQVDEDLVERLAQIIDLGEKNSTYLDTITPPEPPENIYIKPVSQKAHRPNLIEKELKDTTAFFKSTKYEKYSVISIIYSGWLYTNILSWRKKMGQGKLNTTLENYLQKTYGMNNNKLTNMNKNAPALVKIYETMINKDEMVVPRWAFIALIIVIQTYQYTYQYEKINDKDEHFWNYIIKSFVNQLPDEITLEDKGRVAKTMKQFAMTHPHKVLGSHQAPAYGLLNNYIEEQLLHLKTQYFALQDYSDMFGRNALDSLAHNIGIVIFDNIRRSGLKELMLKSYNFFHQSEQLIEGTISSLIGHPIRIHELLEQYNNPIINPDNLVIDAIADRPPMIIELLSLLPIKGFVFYQGDGKLAPQPQNYPEQEKPKEHIEEEPEMGNQQTTEQPTTEDEILNEEPHTVPEIFKQGEENVEEKGIPNEAEAQKESNIENWDGVEIQAEQSNLIYKTGKEYSIDGSTITFKGTDSLKEWKDNVKIGLKDLRDGKVKTKGGEVIQAHRGIYDSIRAIYDPLFKSKIRKLVDKGEPINITGHSRGGMMGTLIALLISEDFPNVKWGDVNMFSTPHMGNQALYDAIKERGIPLQYIGALDDPVFHLKIPNMGDIEQRIYLEELEDGYTKIHRRPRMKENDLNFKTLKEIKQGIRNKERHSIKYVKKLLKIAKHKEL